MREPRHQLRPLARVQGYVAGILATLSLLSLVFYYANAFLPIGRITSMAWTVIVAIVLLRRLRSRRSLAGSP
ncbi:hypothetical protein [Amycolatopsis balhimycina]|uniref:hypothetical protein n=1 Tax=Amycolatopsis balhimycina TaxID=208443 RepID=UPI000377D5AD|nr:hypothetical protein [Amycolatopsis balhimycina]